jgi:putative membrane protein
MFHIETTKDRSQGMRVFSFILLLVVVLIGVTFAALNHNEVLINYYIGQRTLPLSFLLVISFISGSLLSLSVGFWLLIKIRIKNYRLSQQLKITEKEIENLRAIPLQDRH